ncbi:MAG: hypothetical protein Q9174_005003, partial [Haloplaca sp. 1 TL-2023]
MDSPPPPDPYKALDVPKDASLATIRTAHRKLVLKTHPDKVQGDEELKKKRAGEFHLIQQAYEILSDDSKRKAYDEQIKLVTLRAEMMAERGGSRNMSDSRPMGGRSPVVEVRGGRVYEERVPRRSYEDTADDFFNSKQRETHPKYDDYIPSSTARKPSGRWQEYARRAQDADGMANNKKFDLYDTVRRARAHEMEQERDRERERERERERQRWERGAAKAERKSSYAESTRKRDKTRREDYDSKYSRSRTAFVEDGSDTSSDSDDSEVTYQPRKREEIPRPRYEEIRRKDREETPRKPSKRSTEDLPPAVYESKLDKASDYIRQSREPEVEVRRPAMYKGASTREIRPVSPPHVSDNVRRSSGRTPLRRESSPPLKSVAKPKRVTEIVEPPEPQRPRMPGTSSDPKGLRGMASSSSKVKPLRASTLDYVPEARQPSMRRADTMPINKSRHDDNKYSKSSRAREHESDYSSPDQAAPSPKTKSRQIFVVDEDDKVSHRDYNTVYVTPPEGKYRRERELSPPKRKSSDRPSLSGRAETTSRMPPSRNASYAPEATDRARAPRLERAETAYVSPLGSSRQSTTNGNSPRQFFGEIPQHEDPPYK